MNTCARLESSGARGRIHISKETANHFIKEGKEAWLEKRMDVQHLKGLGSVETYWLLVQGERANSVHSAVSSFSGGLEMVARGNYGPKIPGLDARTYRLIDWNVEMLLNIAKQIVARRSVVSKTKRRTSTRVPTKSTDISVGATPLEEVREIIALPEFDEHTAPKQVDPETIEIPSNVVAQLHHLVSVIATMYNANPFHNFGMLNCLFPL